MSLVIGFASLELDTGMEAVRVQEKLKYKGHKQTENLWLNINQLPFGSL